MTDKLWEENVIFITDSIEEMIPTGKRPYESIHFGPMTESRFVYIPENENNVPEFIQLCREHMHDRLVAAMNYAVNKAIEDGRLINIPKRKD